MGKKLEFTEEVVERDLVNFLSKMSTKKDSIGEFLKESEMVETLLPMFQSGELRIEEKENKVLLIQKVEDNEIVMTAKRAKLGDLNRIKPPNYDKLDEESKRLVKVSYLTGIPYTSLLNDYYISDLGLAITLTNFL